MVSDTVPKNVSFLHETYGMQRAKPYRDRIESAIIKDLQMKTVSDRI